MPVIKSAIKKLRQDKKREEQNDLLRNSVKSAIRLAKKKASSESVKSAISLIDKATKKGLIHENKASRLKSALSKLAKTTTSKSVAKKSPEKTVKKTPKSSKSKAS